MKILRMHAVFGKLDGETLECNDGLNLFTLPNEAGKTTWSAFLLAMLYGVNTRERTTETLLAVKERYAPWNGKPMEGRIDLVWNGKNITIERTSTARTPMGKFRAYHTETGTEIEELTADNCGQALLGVSRAAYERSAFIGQNAMAVTQEASLEQRLASLAATGDETVSYSAVFDVLKRWKNNIFANSAHGRRVEAQAELDAIAAKLHKIEETHRADLDLADEQRKLEAEHAELTKAAALLQLKEKAAVAANAKKVRQAVADAEAAAEASAKRAEGLPDEQTLESLERRMDQFETEQKNFAARTAPQERLPSAPDAPQPLRGLSAEEAEAKGAADAQILQKSPVCIPAVILAVLGIAALIMRYFVIGGALFGAAVVWQIVLFALHANKVKAVRNAYNAQDVAVAAQNYAQKLRDYDAAVQAEHERVNAERAAQAAQKTELDDEQAAILLSVRGFAQNIYDLNDARNAVLHAKQTLKQKSDDAINLEATRRLAAAQPNADEEITLPPEAEAETRTPGEVAARLHAVSARLAELNQTLAQHRGAVESLGDPAALAAENERLTERIGRLNARLSALELAMKTLNEANDELSARFSPQLNEEAGRIFARLTSDRYHTLAADRELQLTATEQGAVTPHTLAWLSSGATDQAYLALRLAIARLALPEDAPLVLDDALVYFDDKRLKRALDLLREEATKRQILLFTCQEREKNLATDSTKG